MSTRAIAPTVGASNKTVSLDRRHVLPEVTPAPEEPLADWQLRALKDAEANGDPQVAPVMRRRSGTPLRRTPLQRSREGLQARS